MTPENISVLHAVRAGALVLGVGCLAVLVYRHAEQDPDAPCDPARIPPCVRTANAITCEGGCPDEPDAGALNEARRAWLPQFVDRHGLLMTPFHHATAVPVDTIHGAGPLPIDAPDAGLREDEGDVITLPPGALGVDTNNYYPDDGGWIDMGAYGAYSFNPDTMDVPAEAVAVASSPDPLGVVIGPALEGHEGVRVHIEAFPTQPGEYDCVLTRRE